VYKSKTFHSLLGSQEFTIQDMGGGGVTYLKTKVQYLIFTPYPLEKKNLKSMVSVYVAL